MTLRKVKFIDNEINKKKLKLGQQNYITLLL